MSNLKNLQSGTDIRGIAIKHNDILPNFTEKEVYEITRGFIFWLKKIYKTDITIAVGCDSRLSGEALKLAAIKALKDNNINCYDCGLATTPAMFMTTVMGEYNTIGAMMITASHMPYYYNGIKFFTKKGGCEKEEILEIISLSKNKDNIEGKGTGKVEKRDLIRDYSEFLMSKIISFLNIEGKEKPLEGLKIIVDAGNGSGGFFATKVLKPLGADISGSQFLNPDGNFPAHIPNPEDERAMESIKKAVLKNNADLGIIFDTDVDRAAIVSKTGMEINKNSLIALISAIVLEEHPKSTIVTDSVTSDGLKKFIENLGGKHHRFKRGYKNIINEAIRLNNEGEKCYLAIETSGHAALKENYFLDDGAYLIIKILAKITKMKSKGSEITELIKNLEIAKESESFRIAIKIEGFKKYGLNLLKDIEVYGEKNKNWKIVRENYEGVKFNFNNGKFKGWFLIRISLHEPVMVINIESDNLGGNFEILKELKLFLKKYQALDIENL